MSCKVFTKSAKLALGKLYIPSADGTASAAYVPEGSGAPADAFATDHVNGLHSRIVDLEQALKTNVRQAREAGFREGEKAGLQHGTAEIQPVLERLNRSLAEVAGLRSRIRREAEADLVSLAMAIARRILRRELSVEPEAIQGLIKAALEKAQARDICKVRIHPDFAGAVRRHFEVTGSAPGADIVGDPSLQPGDLIVETKRGDLDASVDVQLREIERGFADRLREVT
jgi:flagellar assembly protein FliH